MTGMGAGWIPNQPDCVESGGNWTAGAPRPCDLYEPRCLAQGGTWDAAALTCTLPGEAPIDIRQWCADDGRQWDPQHLICYDAYNESGCVDAGGYWDAAAQDCLVAAPAGKGPPLSKGATTALIATGGVVLLGLGLLFYAG